MLTRERWVRWITAGRRERVLSTLLDRVLAARVRVDEGVIVCGFWRSGTTWLQQMLAETLGAKTVYEPLHPLVPGTGVLHAMAGMAAKRGLVRELFMPYVDRPITMNDPLYQHLERALRGVLPGGLVRRLRSGVRESFRRRVVVKMVRGQLCLRPLQDAFRLPVVHIYRDPRGMLASVRGTDWPWLFDHLKLAEQLLEPADGRQRLFLPWQRQITTWDRRGKVAVLVGYWALTERVLQASFAGASRPLVSVRYEELCERPLEVLERVVHQLGISRVRDVSSTQLRASSVTTSPTRLHATAADRIDGWRRVLSPAEAAMVVSVAHELDLADRITTGER